MFLDWQHQFSKYIGTTLTAFVVFFGAKNVVIKYSNRKNETVDKLLKLNRYNERLSG